MFNLFYIDGNKMDLSRYAVVFEEHVKASKAYGYNFGKVGHIKAIMDETAKSLGGTSSGDFLAIEMESNELAHEPILAFLFMKRAWYQFEEL